MKQLQKQVRSRALYRSQRRRAADTCTVGRSERVAGLEGGYARVRTQLEALSPTATEARRYDTAMGFQAAQAPVQDAFRRPTFQVPAQLEQTATAATSAPAAQASNSKRFDNALGAKQQPAGPAAVNQYHIEKLVEKVEIHAAPGDDGEALYDKFINVFHRKAKEAASILSYAVMGRLL